MSITVGNIPATKFNLKGRMLAQTGAILGRATALGYTLPNDTQIYHMNTFIRELIKNGLWDTMDAYFEFAFNDVSLQNFSLINWKNPAGPVAATFGGMTFGTQGWLGNGIDGYIDTNWNPTTTGSKYTLNNGSRSAVIYQSGNNNGSIDYNGTTNNMRSITANQRINSGSGFSAALTGIGFKNLGRTSSTDVLGVSQAILTNVTGITSTTITNATFKLCMLNTAFSTTGICNYMGGSALTFDQTQSFRVLYNRYIGNLGLTTIA